jgi:hypothetical protein
MADRDPWVAIVRAAKAGRGVSLSWAEVQHMARADDAIQAAAESCGTECVCDIMRGGRECPTCETRFPKEAG